MHEAGATEAFDAIPKRDMRVPALEQRYRTTGDHGPGGHLLGGVFAACALFAAPDYFQGLGITSPPL